MFLDRSTKTLFAVFTLVASTFLVVNHIISAAPLEDWLLAGVLFAISLTLWAWLWQENQPKITALALRDNGHLSTLAQEWIITKPAPPAVDASILAPHDRALVEEGVVALEEGGPVYMDTLEVNRFRSTDEIVSAVGPGQLMEAMVVTAVTRSDEEADDLIEAMVAHSATRSDEEADDLIEAMVAHSATRSDEEADDDAPVPDSSLTDGDDLTRIEGIGPKYSQALRTAGITTFEKLATASLDTLEMAISGTALRRPASIDTWSEQASYLVRGDEAGLEALQNQLKGGRRTDENQN